MSSPTAPGTTSFLNERPETRVRTAGGHAPAVRLDVFVLAVDAPRAGWQLCSPLPSCVIGDAELGIMDAVAEVRLERH